ncbi:MAG: metal ABC transporter substrate-binding protein [Ruaniaceae bacterium]|nr:metal ABC transporter substrate-binding protein [Ruaniaceae bacterium]
MRRLSRSLLLCGAAALALAGCSLTDDLTPGATPPAEGSTAEESATEGGAPTPGELVAMTTTTPLGSIVGQIAQCGGGTAATIMGIGDDPHSFQPSSEQVAAMVNAPLVVISGLGLEESLLSAVAAAEADGAQVLEIGPLIEPLTFDETGGSDDHDHDGDGHEDHAAEDHAADEHATDEHATDEHEDHDHDGDLDPHWWLDVSRMATAAGIIGDELAEQTGNADFAACGTEIEQELRTLDQEIEETLAIIPTENRKLVTDHRAFGYFANRYGFEMVGAVVPSASTDAEASSADLAELIHTIEELQIPAIFTNVASPTALADAVAAEVGFDVQVVSLFTESLGPEGSGAESYQDMMRSNAELVAEALSSLNSH